MIKMIKTTELTFTIPLNGGDNYRKNECAEQIAQLIDEYFDTSIEEMTGVNDLINYEILKERERTSSLKADGGAEG